MFDKSLWTKELLAWYLYDFANSFITITMTVYFSQWLVVDKKVSDFWFSLAFVVPIHESSTFFGLYTFAERFASVVGPLV